MIVVVFSSSLKILLEEDEEDGRAGGPLSGAHWEGGALQGSTNSLLQGQRRSANIFLEEELEDGGGGAGGPWAGAPWGEEGALIGLHVHCVAARSTNMNYVKYYVCSLLTRCTRSEIKKQSKHLYSDTS